MILLSSLFSEAFVEDSFLFKLKFSEFCSDDVGNIVLGVFCTKYLHPCPIIVFWTQHISKFCFWVGVHSRSSFLLGISPVCKWIVNFGKTDGWHWFRVNTRSWLPKEVRYFVADHWLKNDHYNTVTFAIIIIVNNLIWKMF